MLLFFSTKLKSILLYNPLIHPCDNCKSEMVLSRTEHCKTRSYARDLWLCSRRYPSATSLSLNRCPRFCSENPSSSFQSSPHKLLVGPGREVTQVEGCRGADDPILVLGAVAEQALRHKDEPVPPDRQVYSASHLADPPPLKAHPRHPLQWTVVDLSDGLEAARYRVR